MNCPHLLSHEMTGQVSSGALDQFSQFSRTSFSGAVHFARPSSVLFSGRMGCDAVFALPATVSTATSLDSTPTDDVSLCNRTCQSPHVSHCTLRDWHHLQYWLVQSFMRPVRRLRQSLRSSNPVLAQHAHVLGKYIAHLTGQLLHVMVSISGSRSKSGILREMVTLSKRVMTSGTKVSNRDCWPRFSPPALSVNCHVDCGCLWRDGCLRRHTAEHRARHACVCVPFRCGIWDSPSRHRKFFTIASETSCARWQCPVYSPCLPSHRLAAAVPPLAVPLQLQLLQPLAPLVHGLQTLQLG